MSEKAIKPLLKEIKTLFKKGKLHINRLKDPNSDCQVDIKVGTTTFLDCNELIHHYRDENQMLAYTTIELTEKSDNYYYLEIRNYAKGETLRNKYPSHSIIKQNSCVTPTARTW